MQMAPGILAGDEAENVALGTERDISAEAGDGVETLAVFGAGDGFGEVGFEVEIGLVRGFGGVGFDAAEEFGEGASGEDVFHGHAVTGAGADEYDLAGMFFLHVLGGGGEVQEGTGDDGFGAGAGAEGAGAVGGGADDAMAADGFGSEVEGRVAEMEIGAAGLGGADF